MTKTLTRVYDDYASAEATVQELKNAGLGDSHIGIVASNADGWHKPGGGRKPSSNSRPDFTTIRIPPIRTSSWGRC